MKKLFIILVIIIILACQGCKSDDSQQAQDPQKYITILWAQWKPADYLQQLTEDFTKQTGIKVNIVQDSWGTWQKLFLEEMQKKDKCKFDIVIGDSQWLGIGATKGHYVELTAWIKKHGVDKSMTDASLKGYAEFPKTSGKYWAIPFEGDAMGFSYRKDLFEDPNEKKAFKQKYGYELDVPKTWYQLKDIAEFFYRPEKDLYGALIWSEPHYDGLTMAMQTLIWAWGAQLGEDRTYKINGVLNTEKAIEALEFYKQLNQYNNPKWVNYYLDTNLSSNKPMINGKVAMAMVYFAISPELLDRSKNPYADVTGFFASPIGPQTKATSLGGQGASIISYSRKKEYALDFLQWFIKDETQKKWAQLGGLPCNKNILYSQEFLNASPINKPYVESMEMVKDFWAVPQYTQLLKVSQKYWYLFAIKNEISPKDAVNNITKEWETIFEYAGYYKE